MDESSLQLVSEIGIQLGRLARPNKDFLVKSLRQAANALAQIEPPSPPEASRKKEAVNKLASGIKPLGKSFVKHGLLRNSDKDVKLLVAICISEIFRILAPEPPFEDKYLRDVFKLILSMFAELADTTSPYFSRRVKILETVARCKCFVILLDIDCNDLVLEMFNIFFSIVRENHQRSLINDVLSIMTHILNEEASLPLSDVILRNLVKEGTAASAAASQLAASVIQSCAEKLEPFICGFLTSCSLDRDAIDSELKEFYHEILFKVFQCAPQMLLAVIPNLTQELLTDQVDVRIKAVNLIGRLFALPEHHVAEKYHNLFIEFKNRFSDKSVEVRLSALRCAKACYMANPSGKESSELLSAVEGRLLDFDDRVRILAVVVVCDLARFNLKYFSAELLSKAVERLRDKKISVRKKALQKLMEVYQEYCNKCSESYLTIGGHFEQIPCKILMLCYDKDCKEFRSQNMEPILAEDLFPARLSVEDRTRHWIHFFSLFTPLHVKALNSILSQKRRLQNEMQSYLALRKKEKESGSEEMQKRIKNSFMKMSASFPDPSKAEECFHKLNQMKDNNIFNSLELLLVERTIINAQTTRDKFLKMIGDKHPHFEFLQLLSSKCSFNIFSSEHVRCILDHLSSDAVGNGRLEASSANLLLEKNMINDVLIEALAKAGPYISVKFSDFYPLLESACLEGTRIQSKQAVSAIASLIGSSEQLIFSKLCKELVDSLHRGWNTPTILQSLGCIAQHSVAAFESKYREIRSYIFQRIFQVEQSDDLTIFYESSECCHSCKLKIYGVKTLVKSFLPHQGSHVNRQIDELLDILLKLLQTGDAIDGIITCVNDKPHVRLAAAKSVLRLSRRWDLHISPEIFRSTILVAKDLSSLVRRSFLNKTHKLLKEHAIPNRYACAFVLAASDFCEDLQDAPFKYMEEFVKEYNIVARNRQNSAVQEGTVTDYPAYIVVFLIHTLAHSTGFPPEDSRDEQEYAHFCRPLFLVVQALLSANIANGDADLVNDAVMYLLSIFRAIKRAEDALDATKTPKLQILAEIGISIVNALNLNGITLSRAPGMIFLPSSFYRISSVKKCDEASLKCLNQFSVDESFVKRIVHSLKSQISMPASSLPKRGRKCQADGIQSAKYNTLNMAPLDHANLLRTETIDMQKLVSPDISLRHRKKSAASESVGLHNEVSRTNASKSSKSMKKDVSSSCDSATTRPSANESQTLIWTVDGTIPYLKESGRASSRLTAESSKRTTSKPNEPCCSRTFSTENEALIGKRVKLLSPVDRCFYSGTVVGFNPGNNTHKISYDSGEVELLCLDSESWETVSDSPTEKETTFADQHKKSHSSEWNLKETVNTFGDGATTQSNHLANKENEKVSNGMTSFPAKGRKGQKLSSDTPASVVTNNEDAFVRRTRRRKV
ncbi:sister chromatid cohesion protein PDS5 homolog B isoform X2 [Ricinus communis]|uniref:sister chromatid cohesion protein PDS5 homolog B isoform X2 n=1 Tax=Ricinus communis TaxID=3988 RepID=UPI00077219A9|nr:sister chromatid cohesion protein PDS5 homolog B isoform X2 [Ricinus communis]|eukprot:XP_015571530.1 sister chromatid cohesion protein PDS5 homolog A isoform X2 [Ricinus communis]